MRTFVFASGRTFNMKEKKMSKQTRNNINGFLFALPWIVGFICFSIYPLVSSFYYSFTTFNAVTTPTWVGLKNYENIFKDVLVWKSLKNTLFMAFVSTPINLCLAVSLSYLVNKKFRGRGLARTLFFMPSIIPVVASTMVWIWMFDPTYGLLNTALEWFGINGPAWLNDPSYTKWALLLMGSWSTGTTMLICLAALQEVPISYYESAQLDGANAVTIFFKITLPNIAHVLLYQGILIIISSFQYFTQVYVVIAANAGAKAATTSGGPANSILMYPLYIFYNAFGYLKMGKASAMAWVLFAIVAILTIIMVKLSKKTSEVAGSE